MGPKVELILDENTYLLNSLSYEIDQAVDKFGRPSSISKGGKIEIELYSVDNDVIFDWMIHPRKTINGTINLYEGDNETKLKEIKFENAYCIDYTESFDQIMGDFLVTKLTISAEKLTIGSVDLDNQWLN
jgi:hypothetical protein